MLYATYISTKNLALIMMPPSGINDTMASPLSLKPNKSNPTTNNASPMVLHQAPTHGALQPIRQHAQPSRSSGRTYITIRPDRTAYDATYGLNYTLTSIIKPTKPRWAT